MTKGEVMQKLLDAMAREFDPSRLEAYARAYATLHYCERSPCDPEGEQAASE